LPELVWIIDPASGDLVVEGLDAQEALALASDLLPSPKQLNCAQPLATVPLPRQGTGQGPLVRVEALYHGSAVEGPGRRSVLQVRGCPLRCRGCAVPQTHPSDGGVVLSVDQVVEVLLDPAGEPRDGITVIGGEPFAQPVGLAAVLRRVKARGLHTTVYTGYTLAALAQHSHPAVRAALELSDLLIDGPFVEDLAEGAGEWRGSRNQRLISNPAAVFARAGSRAQPT
jgi:anaerobic ribonucleoside-triphosphate reductase activating protein